MTNKASITAEIILNTKAVMAKPTQAEGVLPIIPFIHLAIGGKATHAISEIEKTDTITPDANTDGCASFHIGK